MTLVIAAYDAAPFVQRAIRSALAQTHRPREIIVVDDGSQDDTAEVARRMGPEVTVLRQPNRGPGSARNSGVRAATSELVCFLDADDEYCSHMVATLRRALDEHPHADVASAAYFVESLGRLTRSPSTPGVAADGACLVLRDFFSVARRRSVVHTSSVMVRKRAFEAVNGFREDIRFGEDIDLWCKLAGRYGWVFVNTPVSIYHHSSATSSTLRTPDAQWPTDILMGEAQMREHVRPELWRSYRMFRRDWLSARARAAVQESASARARQLLVHVAPAPLSLMWVATWMLAYAPGEYGRALLKLNRRARGVLARR